MALDGGHQQLHHSSGADTGGGSLRRGLAAACGACFVAGVLAFLIGFELSGLKAWQSVFTRLARF
jgi:hypothetical protein